MASYLLDTDAVIDYVAAIPDSVSLIRGLFERGDALCVSAVVVAEVYSGLAPAATDRVQPFLEACTFLPTGYEEARQAGRWRHDFARRGIALSTTDMLVAATAVAYRAAIVTGNAKDYPMEGVTVVPLPRASR